MENDKKRPVTINYLMRTGFGIAISIKLSPGRFLICENVPENIVRTAIGEDTMDYLLDPETADSNYCKITDSVFNDFKKYMK